MRVLFTCVGYTGHFHPLVPFARALVEAGHTVSFATWPQLQSMVVASGFDWFQAGVNMEQDTAINAKILSMPEFQVLPPQAGKMLFGEHKFVRLLPQVKLPDLAALCTAWSPDLLVSESCEYAGHIAAEQYGIPHATVKIDSIFTYNNRYSLAPAVADLRATAGLPPDPEDQMLYRYLYLVTEPLSLIPAGVTLPPTAFHLRHSTFDQSGAETLPEWIAHLADRPVVYATLAFWR